MTDAIVPVYRGESRSQYEPKDIPSALEVVEKLVPTGLLPKHVKTPQAALLQIILGREYGLTMMQSLMGMYVVEGVPCLKTEVLVGLVKSHRDCEYLTVVEASDAGVTVEGKRRGTPGPVRMTWTIEDARRAVLAGKGPWRQYPKRMLMWRAYGDLIKAEFADLTTGLGSWEEMEDATIDVSRSRDVSPIEERQAAVRAVLEAQPTAATAVLGAVSREPSERYVRQKKRFAGYLRDSGFTREEMRAAFPAEPDEADEQGWDEIKMAVQRADLIGRWVRDSAQYERLGDESEREWLTRWTCWSGSLAEIMAQDIEEQQEALEALSERMYRAGWR